MIRITISEKDGVGLMTDRLKLISTLYGLSPREIEILSRLAIENSKVINSVSKKVVMKDLGLKNLNQYISSISKKGLISRKSRGEYEYRFDLTPDDPDIWISFEKVQEHRGDEGRVQPHGLDGDPIGTDET